MIVSIMKPEGRWAQSRAVCTASSCYSSLWREARPRQVPAGGHVEQPEETDFYRASESIKITSPSHLPNL